MACAIQSATGNVKTAPEWRREWEVREEQKQMEKVEEGIVNPEKLSLVSHLPIKTAAKTMTKEALD